MKKVVLILILAVCLVFPSAVLLSGCGKKPINVSNQTFKFDSVKVEWAKGTSGADKSSILAKYNKGTEKELFSQLAKTCKSIYENITISFSSNGTFTMSEQLVGTYIQDGKNLSLTIQGETKNAKVNGEKIEIVDKTAVDSNKLNVTIVFVKGSTSSSTPSTTPQSFSVKGKTFTLESITTNWVAGTTNQQKQAILTAAWCNTEDELFEMLESGSETLTLVFDNTNNCNYSTSGNFSVNLDLTFTETNSTVVLSLYSDVLTFTKSNNKLTSTQTLEDYPCIEQTIVLSSN